MKSLLLENLIVLLLCSSFTAHGWSQVESIPWEASNIAKLNKLDKGAVAAFLNRDRDPGTEAVSPYDIEQFKWVDLAGDGLSELLVETHHPALSALSIYWHEGSGAYRSQTLVGEMNGIQDLDGTGSKEIIMDSYLDVSGRRAAGTPTPIWPQVYRLDGEKYVPASKDFHEYYDLKVLPKLDKKIGEAPAGRETVGAALNMERDKIERVLGRDPNAGLDNARRWARSDNPDLIDDAVDVFRDIGGHEDEARAAEQAKKQALERERADHPNS